MVKDPEDGTVRTPKPLLATRGPFPHAQAGGTVTSLGDETASATATSEMSDAFLGRFSSMGGMSMLGGSTGSVTQSERSADDDYQNGLGGALSMEVRSCALRLLCDLLRSPRTASACGAQHACMRPVRPAGPRA